MDQELLVGDQIEDGRKLITQLTRSGFEVTVAFWVETREEGLWHLYIASPSVSPETVGAAYGNLYLSLNQMPDVSIDLSDVKLIAASNPTAILAAALRDRQRTALPIRIRTERLGDLLVQEAYIYPRISQALSRDEVLQIVMSILKGSGPVEPLTVTFADGSIKQAIPVGIQLQEGSERGLQIVFYDPRTRERQAIAANKVVNIQKVE
jgi:hypothetical protein